jgi:peptidoglycan/LPS O-acetylase OafA/YrhL
LPSAIRFWTDPIILEFVFGMMIALAFRHGRFLAPTAGLVLVALGLAGLGVSIVLGPYYAHRVIVWGVPSALIVAGAALTPVNFRGLHWKIMEVLGNASYSIYLVHLLVYIPLRHRLAAIVDPATMPLVYGAMLLLAAILTSIATHYLFERPVTRFLQRRLALVTSPRPWAVP